MMVLAMAVFTCWCCKALLGWRKTGGEPRPRCAKLWIWFWDILIIFIPKCLGLPDNWADIAVGEDFRSRPPVVFCSWSDIFNDGRRKHWMVGSVMVVIYISCFWWHRDCFHCELCFEKRIFSFGIELKILCNLELKILCNLQWCKRRRRVQKTKFLISQGKERCTTNTYLSLVGKQIVKNALCIFVSAYLLSGGLGGPMRTLGLGIRGTFLIWANRSAGIPGPVWKRAF